MTTRVFANIARIAASRLATLPRWYGYKLAILRVSQMNIVGALTCIKDEHLKKAQSRNQMRV